MRKNAEQINRAEQTDTLLLRAAASDWSIARLSAEYSKEHLRDALTGFAFSPAIYSPPRFSSVIYDKLVTNRAEELLPDQAWEELRARHYRILALETIKYKWLLDLGSMLAEHGIDIVLLKAAAFNGSVYKLMAPRPGSDIDLLVQPADFDRLIGIFNNYLCAMPPLPERKQTFERFFERGFFAKNKQPFPIDVHKALTHPFLFKIDHRDLFLTSREHANFKRLPLRRLAPEYSLLHLAIHAVQHSHAPLHTLLDAHETIIKEGADIDRTVELADEWGAKGALYLLLSLCRQHLRTPIDDRKIDRLRGAVDRRLILTLGRNIPRTDKFAVLFRLRQLALQCAIVDNPRGTFLYWMYYARLRLADLLRNR